MSDSDSDDTAALDDEVTTTKWHAAQRIKDWLHTPEGTPYSACGAWADTCPDWALAWTLAEAALELPRSPRNLPEPNGPCHACATGTRRPRGFSGDSERTLRLLAVAAVVGMLGGLILALAINGVL